MAAITRVKRFLTAFAGIATGGILLLWFWSLTDAPVAAQQGRVETQAKHAPALGPAQPRYVAQNAGPPADRPQDGRPLLEVYPCRPGEAAVLGARLREEFGQGPNVRIVVDERTSQVLVQAPPGIQARIADRLNRAPAAAAGPQGTSPAPPAAEAIRSREIPLRHADTWQVEAALVETLGKRLSPAPVAAAGIKSYRLTLPGGRRITLAIHYQANLVTIRGAGKAVESCVRLVQAFDQPRARADQSMRLVSLRAADRASVRRAVDALRSGSVQVHLRSPMIASLFQARDEAQPAVAPSAEPAGPPAAANGAAVNGAAATGPPANAQPPGAAPQAGGLIGPVQIEYLEGLDMLIIRGHQRDVDQVMRLIEEIERISAETVPVVEVYALRHVDCVALEALITPLYEAVFSPRHGNVSITPLVKPNALLLIGRVESVQAVLDLVKRLDRPVAPNTQFRVFRLRYAAASTAEQTVSEFFGEGEEERVGLEPRVLVTADFRSNSLIVRASPRDMVEVAKLIERIDTDESETVNEIRVFELRHSLAEELAPILQDAITGQAGQRAAGAQPAGAAAGQAVEAKSAMLRFVTVDTEGQRRLSSGILLDARVVADLRANTLLVSAPAKSMELIAALIDRLDQPPAAQAQIKVFTIVNGDASNLMDMLETLFGAEQAGAAGGPAIQTAAAEGESSLVELRFAVDVRTNSIIASGSMGELQVVEAILLRLDASEVRQRKTEVYRLMNAPAADVSEAINSFLRSEREVLEIEPGLLSAFEQIEREVVVVPEIVSNSLIVSATPRFFEEIKQLVEKLDKRPPMVMIQVLIAEVLLNDTDEFGVELGLQDSLMFDRSLLEILDTITTTTQDQTPGGATTSTTTQEIVSANITPGFLFNNTQPLGNAGSSQALAASGTVGTQGLSNFSVGRLNSELGFGGLVLSASSEAVSILIRALREDRRLDVLSRPQIMTLDNQPAFIQVGERVPRVIGATIDETGQQINTTLENLGLILGVTPRISPDGLVVMEIDVDKSELGPEEEGIPISISATGEVIRSPRINNTTAQTTVAALDGQTVVLGGLLTKSVSTVRRRVPWLADVPVLGHLFRYDIEVEQKTELLIIMTPHVIENEEDAERVKQVEASRMHWCLCDVVQMHGDGGLRGRRDPWSDSETYVIYPDMDPTAEGTSVPSGTMVPGPNGELIPLPDGAPLRQEPVPAANGNPFREEMRRVPGAAPPQPTPDRVPSGQTTPAPPPPGATAPPAGPPPASGAGVLEQPRFLPTGTELRLRAGEQARSYPGYPAVHPGGVQPAVYQGPGGLPAPQYAGPGPVVPSAYQHQAAPPYDPPPMIRLPYPQTPPPRQ